MKPINVALLVAAVAMTGCRGVLPVRTAAFEFPQELRVDVGENYREWSTFELRRDTAKERNALRPDNFEGNLIKEALVRRGFAESMDGKPDVIIFGQFDIQSEEVDTSTPAKTRCSEVSGDVNCETIGGYRSTTLASFYIQLSAFAGWRDGRETKHEFLWGAKTVLYAGDPRQVPDEIFTNMVQNLEPYLVQQTNGMIEVPYP